mgnify:CR=1 FL=1
MKTDNSSDNKFRYSYSAPTESERREIDSIRRAYLPQSEQMSGLERLRLLDKESWSPSSGAFRGRSPIRCIAGFSNGKRRSTARKFCASPNSC